MNEEELVKYYNKFNEDKRLKTKHGNIEYLVANKYIHEYLKKDDKIIDIGAGCGAYSIPLYKEGYDVTAVELVKHNLKVINQKEKSIKTIQANATNLSMIKDNTYDITILFGPMYHLISLDDKIKSLNEAKRITKKGGFIFISYCMNEYAIITHGFIEGYIKDSINLKQVDNNFKIISKPNDLYSYVRLKDINYIKNKCKLKRVKIISQDGPTEYIKKYINNMDDTTYNIYIKYIFSICEDKYMLNSSRHILDILKVI